MLEQCVLERDGVFGISSQIFIPLRTWAISDLQDFSSDTDSSTSVQNKQVTVCLNKKTICGISLKAGTGL